MRAAVFMCVVLLLPAAVGGASTAAPLFGLYEGTYSIEGFGVSPSGQKVIFLVGGGGPDGGQMRVMLREYAEDGAYVDREVCGGGKTEAEEGDRRVVRWEWVSWAGPFHWLDEERVVFSLWWRELEGNKKGLVLYDGAGLRTLVEGVAYTFSVYDNRLVAVYHKVDRPWITADIGEEGLADLRDITDFDPSSQRLWDPVIVSDRIYMMRDAKYGKRYSLELWEYDLGSRKLEQACKYDGVVLAKSAQGTLAYAVDSRQPWVHGTVVDWGLIPGLADLLVIDGAGTQHWLTLPEGEANEEETIAIALGVFSPDGQRLLLAVDKGNERTELFIWRRYYVLDWVKGEWVEVKKPTVEGANPTYFYYWRPNGVWWWADIIRGEKKSTSMALVKGFEEVDGQ